MTFVKSRYSVSCGIIAIVLAVAVLLGWYLKIPLLIQVLPTFVPMQYNTALGFLFCGAGLLMLNLNRRVPASIFGFLAFTVGDLTLLEYVFEWNLGIDELFMEHYITVKTAYPGRMAPNTALCFSLIGISLFLGGMLRKRPISIMSFVVLGGFVVVLSSVATLGYLMKVETAYGWGQLTRMALHTSVGFLIAGSGTVFLGWNNFAERFNSLRWVPLLWSTSLLFISMILFYANSIHEKKLIRNEMNSKIDALKINFVEKLDSRIRSLARMANRWKRNESFSHKGWEFDALAYLNDYSEYRAISWVDTDYKVRRIVPLGGNEGIVGLDNKKYKNRLDTFKKSQFLNLPLITPVMALKQKEKGFLMVFPLVGNERFGGFIVAAISLKAFLDQIFDPTFQKNFSFKINEMDDLIHISGEEGFYYEPFWRTSRSLEMAGLSWDVEFWPKKHFIDKTSSPVSIYLLLFGALTSFAVGAIWFLILKERLRVNELKNLTKDLEVTTAKNNLILESVGDGIFGLDKEGKTTFMNSVAGKMLGFKAEDLIGVPQHKMIHYKKPDGSPYPVTECNIYKVLKEGNTQLISDEYFWKKDGSGFPVEYITTPIMRNGNILGAVVTFRDITERKRKEEELNQFAYIVSHDLKAPLRGIHSLSEIILEDIKDNDTESVESNFQLLKDRIKRMEVMITGLLAYSRAGRNQNKIETVDVKNLIEEIVDLLEFPEGFQVFCRGDFPVLATDKIRMSQVFQNLIDNAKKHNTGQKDGKIDITCVEKEEYFEFSVSDNGPGIKEEYFNKIFMMFQTLEPWDKTRNTGLGLALIKKIVEHYGGNISVNSIMGEGSQFSFTWPKVTPYYD
ncbi:MAG: PAS domain S-box protein [Candidatus Nitronauta litoralis]|uniref:histidine kinase n=1 Tax=Candidatus Nitronauta litoralis TaxID=2705533 RepID=A0A7T0BXN8_9BACT|nr:MAG: PAS domain S-box protein [Candidatus Nitronauta litoralis]